MTPDDSIEPTATGTPMKEPSAWLPIAMSLAALVAIAPVWFFKP